MKINSINKFNSFEQIKKKQTPFKANLIVHDDVYALMLARSKTEASCYNVYKDLAENFYDALQKLSKKLKDVPPLDSKIFLIHNQEMEAFCQMHENEVLPEELKYRGPQLTLAHLTKKDELFTYDFTYNFYDENQINELFKVSKNMLSSS